MTSKETGPVKILPRLLSRHNHVILDGRGVLGRFGGNLLDGFIWGCGGEPSVQKSTVRTS